MEVRESETKIAEDDKRLGSISTDVQLLRDRTDPSLLERGIIKELLLAGELNQVENYIKKTFPHLWEEDHNLRSTIWGLKYIDIIKKGDQSAIEKFADEHIETRGEFIAFDKDGDDIMIATHPITITLLNEQEDSLSSSMQRELLSDYISKKILTIKGKEKTTALERFLKQCVVINNHIKKNKVNKPTFEIKE